MKAIELVHATVGTVSSREDGSVAFRVCSAELRPSEAGILMQLHGKSVSVLIKPDEAADELVRVETERDAKSPSQRLSAVIYVHWKQQGGEGDFETFRRIQMDKIIEGYKQKNLEPE